MMSNKQTSEDFIDSGGKVYKVEDGESALYPKGNITKAKKKKLSRKQYFHFSKKDKGKS